MSTETVVQKRRRGRPPVANDTGETILGAAMRLLPGARTEETGLREIAAAAGVDVAYVHRCFGSKKRLFADAVSTAVKPKDFLEEPPTSFRGSSRGMCWRHAGRVPKDWTSSSTRLRAAKQLPMVRELLRQ